MTDQEARRDRVDRLESEGRKLPLDRAIRERGVDVRLRDGWRMLAESRGEERES